MLFPEAGIIKGALLDYYVEVAAVMLPHVRDRPLALHRYPDGIAADSFLQQHRSEHFPDRLIFDLDPPDDDFAAVRRCGRKNPSMRYETWRRPWPPCSPNAIQSG